MSSQLPVRAVITGGPGTGKSTLIDASESAGIAVSREVAREILLEPGGMALRAEDPSGFARAMLDREVAAFRRAGDHSAPVLFDRGFPDIVGFHRLSGLDISDELDRACRNLRYEGPIFRAPPWEAIYAPDSERIQDWAEAQASDAAVTAAWRDYGYEQIDLPLVPVMDRVAFISSRLRTSR